MPRITLAYWHGDHRPGDEVDVTAEELAALTRDGRVAAVHDLDNGGTPEPTPSETGDESEQAEAVVPAPPSARKRR